MTASLSELVDRVDPFIEDRDFKGIVCYLKAIQDLETRKVVCNYALFITGMVLSVDEGRTFEVKLEGDEVSDETFDRVINFIPEDNLLKQYYGLLI